MARGPFVPTHTLKRTIDELGLDAGTPLRLLNVFAYDDPNARCRFLDSWDWENGGEPWVFMPDEVEPLPDWPRIRSEIIDRIFGKGKRDARA